MIDVKAFLGGVTLAGYQQTEDGYGPVRSAHSDAVWPEGWPRELTLEGVTFTLEDVEIISHGPEGYFVNAQYV